MAPSSSKRRGRVVCAACKAYISLTPTDDDGGRQKLCSKCQPAETPAAADKPQAAVASSTPAWNRPWLADRTASFLVFYYVFLLIGRYFIQGRTALFDAAWACNVAMLMAAVALRRRSRLWVSAALGLVAFPHVGWWFDVITYLLTGDFPLGSAKYMTYPETSWFVIATTMHHVWFFPLLSSCLYGNGGIQVSAFPYGAGFFCLLSLLSTPIPLMMDGIYLNINMAHEFWKDQTNVWIRWAFDGRPKLIHILLMSTGSSICNAVGFAVFIILGKIFYAEPQAKLSSKKKVM